MEIVTAKTLPSSHLKASKLFITLAKLLQILNKVFEATNIFKDSIYEFES